jgi:hypothetical protein
MVFPPSCIVKEGMMPCGRNERPSKEVKRVGPVNFLEVVRKEEIYGR